MDPSRLVAGPKADACHSRLGRLVGTGLDEGREDTPGPQRGHKGSPQLDAIEHGSHEVAAGSLQRGRVIVGIARELMARLRLSP